MNLFREAFIKQAMASGDPRCKVGWDAQNTANSAFQQQQAYPSAFEAQMQQAASGAFSGHLSGYCAMWRENDGPWVAAPVRTD